MKKIILTGGGTAGHVTPNIALLPRLREAGFEITYIGSYNGIEKQLLKEQKIPYYGISSGKLRRYFDIKNFSDPLKVIKGLAQSIRLMRKIKPDLVFSKGGFVSVPVILAARFCHIPSIIHESDLTPGLANKLAIPNAAKVCCNFPETLKYLPEDKAVLTGSPIRSELLSGNKENARKNCNFTNEKPILFIVGGSSGSKFINDTIRGLLPELLKTYQIIHMCGKGNIEESLNRTAGYKQYEYIGAELSDIFALADLVISRAGANSICELLALQKPNILIPLSANASRGDQILNAQSFEKQGFSVVIEEEVITPDKLLNMIHETYKNRERYITAMKKSTMINSVDKIVTLIEETAK
ncbi:MAG: undecaprenyldiphospho-muramoylpentapeptide beta-N-acetylglucosaminyltransferase [Eubacterium sp.]|jgi:UDP-N-acetylglucosamine--N-acetylmuramyl-(pentapeptide) pyrophosphoryl-undecaprenol N-acetylglucosamine transferase|nr:undecaprenyldiphospho-muramoylpentapeptide beta-N-acetylglucosaminyltransferase [Eubacterium sp.]